jgi:hydrogenase maturation protease
MTLADLVAPRLLIYGIGNVGRQDDGVGIRVVERLAAAGVRDGVTLEANYQLAPEDALTIARHDAVIFIDATMEPGAPEPYTLTTVAPALDTAITTHELPAASVVSLCARLYGAAPAVYMLAIPGYGFEVNGDLTDRAAAHMEQATIDLQQIAGR